jgi:hypothetical protein
MKAKRYMVHFHFSVDIEAATDNEDAVEQALIHINNEDNFLYHRADPECPDEIGSLALAQEEPTCEPVPALAE